MKRIIFSLIVIVAFNNPIWAQESIVYETDELNESFQVIKQDVPIILHENHIILDDYLFPVVSNNQKFVNVNGTLSNKHVFKTENFSIEVLEKMHEGKDLIIYRHDDEVRIFVSIQRKIRVVESDGTLVTSNNR